MIKRTWAMRTLGVAFVVAASVSLVACGSSPTTGGSATSGGSASNSLVAKIEAHHQMTFGVASFAPDNYQTTSGKWTGTVASMASKVAQSFNATPVFVSTSWSNIIAGLQAGDYEVAIDTTYTAARAKIVNFTVPVYTEVDDLMVSASSGIKTWQEATAAGKTICVAQGATPDLTITKLNLAATIMRLPSEDECNLALVSGRADSHFQDWYGNSAFASVHPGYKMIIPPTALDVGKVAFTINKTWPASDLSTINAHITSLIAGGAWQSLAKQFQVGVPTNLAYPPVPSYAYKDEGYK